MNYAINYLTVSEVSQIMGISTSKAYKIIRSLNDELKSNGYLTIAGKISKPFFESKLYPSATNTGETKHVSL